MGIPPLKHVIDSQSVTVNISTTQTIDLAVGTLNPDPYTNANNVRNGSIIRVIQLQLDIIDVQGETTVTGAENFIDWYVWFNIAGAQTPPNPNSVNISKIKNQIFHQDGAILGLYQRTDIGYVQPWKNSWRLVIAVPKQYQTINDLDKITLVINGSHNAATTAIKVKAIYKEIFP